MRGDELIYSEHVAALFHKGQLVEYWPRPLAGGSDYAIGGLLQGRITSVFHSQNRALCQLPNGEFASFRLMPKTKNLVGDFVSLTLTAMPRQHKPWQATQGLSRAGHYVVLHYGNQEVRASHKAKQAVSPQVITKVKEALPPSWGAVLKRASLNADPQQICDEVSHLLAPLTLPLNMPDNQMFCAYEGDKGAQLWSLSVADDVKRTRLDDDAYWDEIDDRARHDCEETILLESGVRLSIEQTQALLAIDVDSGASRLSPSALVTEVAPQIMRLIRLACYSGVIIVDMPRLSKEQGASCLRLLRACAADDIRHPDVLGFTKSGLIEIIVRHHLAPLRQRLPQ